MSYNKPVTSIGIGSLESCTHYSFYSTYSYAQATLTISVELNDSFYNSSSNSNFQSCPYSRISDPTDHNGFGDVCDNLCPDTFSFKQFDFLNDGQSTQMHFEIDYVAVSTAMVM